MEPSHSLISLDRKAGIRKRRSEVSLVIAVIIAAQAFAVRPAHAADAAEAAADQAAAGAAVVPESKDPDEVVVTARRRSESLQTVPVGVSVVSGDDMLKDNRNNIQDLTQLIPSIDFRAQQSNKDRDILIRGLGTVSTSAGAEPTVSTVVDGVVLARPGQMTSDIADIDQVEVLRGPQGTLFGKNASAGVVNITTKNPTPTFEGYVDSAYYSGNEYREAGSVSGPIVPGVVEALLSGVYGHFDGNVKNVYNGDEVNGYDRSGLRAKVLYTPTADLTVLLAADYMNSYETSNGGIFVKPYRIAYPTGAVTNYPILVNYLAGYGITATTSNTTIAQNVPTTVKDVTDGGSAQINYSAGGYDFTSITAYRYWLNVQGLDLSYFTGPTASYAAEADQGHVHEHELTEELRVASPKGGLIDYVVGAYYMHSPDAEDYRRTTTTLPAAGLLSNFGFAQFGATDDNYSVFGEGNINFTSNFRAFLGARLVHDDLSYYHSRITSSPVAVTGIAAPYGSQGSASVSGYSDRAGLQYDVSKGIETYFTYSRGYKGPAYNVFFNMAATNTGLISPETSNDYEVGAKTKLFGNHVTLNVDAFYDTVDNYQANVPAYILGQLVTNLVNAGTVRSEGFEADVVARVTEDFKVNGAITYANATVVNFNCPPGSAASCNVNGQPLPYAPKLKFTVGGNYRVYTHGDYEAGIGSDYSWQSKEQDSLGETPDTIQPSYGIWNANINFSDFGAAWDARFVVKNILNQHYYTSLAEGSTGGGVQGQIGRDFNRYFGFDIHKSF